MAILIVLGVVASTAVGVAVRTWFHDRPPRWSTPYQRLLERNPMLNADQSLPWTVRSRRARTGWLAGTVVAVAVLIATLRPYAATATSDAGDS